MAKAKILVVEDDKFLREMLALVFEEEGYQADAVADGEAAWERLNKQHYALLITDMYMPKMNGVELVTKCQKSFPEIKTVVISGGGREVEAEHGKGRVKLYNKEIQADIFLKKPYNLDEMFTIVDRLLSG
ncbi:MAG: response regulator [Gammaproteobacteria bacterium]|nr:response regulator [Gammaproteobacteria bacterium]